MSKLTELNLRSSLCLTLIMLSLSSPPPLMGTVPTDISANGFLKTHGTLIVTASNRSILLRGANLRFCTAAQGTFEECLQSQDHSESDYEKMASWGFNVVRLGLVWRLIEPRQGAYDIQYLMRYVDREVAWAKRHGIYLILEMHGGRGWNMKWDGSGAPDWAVTQYSPNNDGLSTWIENFWENQTLWTHYANAWSFVASRYSNEPTIVGYDIMNEPYMWYVPGAFDLTKERAHQPYMLRFHELVVDQIRSVDPNHIVFIEPFLLPDRATTREAYSWSQEQIAFDRPNVVWSPHFYVYSLGATYMKPYTHNDIGILEQAMNSLYATFTQFQKPIWIGEFGIEERVPGSDIWTKDVVDLLRAHGFGWAWWAYYREHPNEGSYGLINADGSPRCQFLAYLTDSPQRDTLCPSRSFTASASQVGNQAVPYVPWILLIAGLIVIGLTVRLSRRSVRPLVSAKHA